MTEYISIQSSQDVIEHFGIKGMKWGVHSRHKAVGDARTAYKSAKKQWRKSGREANSGRDEEGNDNAIRDYANMKRYKEQYKLARDHALNRERNKGPLSKDKVSKYKKDIKNYKQVADKYKKGGTHNFYYSPANNRFYETYTPVNKTKQSSTEKKIEKKIRNKGLRRDIAAITGVTAAGLGASIALSR